MTTTPEVATGIRCMQCKERPATVHEPEYMRKYAEKQPQREWARRMLAGQPELCQVCDDRNSSS